MSERPPYTKEQVEAVYALLKQEYEAGLDELGVKLPTLYKKDGAFNAAALQLVRLRLDVGKIVAKDEITAFVRRFAPDLSMDQQPRHLKDIGWDVRGSGKSKGKQISGEKVPEGYYVLAQTITPGSQFLERRRKRIGRLSTDQWDQVLAHYHHRCAVCRESELVEQGHMDPTKPHTMDNIIPMCGDCNNWASEDVVFDTNGRVCALNSPRLVLASSIDVQLKIRDLLNKTLKGR